MIDSNNNVIKAIKDQPIYLGSDIDTMRGLMKQSIKQGNTTFETSFKL